MRTRRWLTELSLELLDFGSLGNGISLTRFAAGTEGNRSVDRTRLHECCTYIDMLGPQSHSSLRFKQRSQLGHSRLHRTRRSLKHQTPFSALALAAALAASVPTNALPSPTVASAERRSRSAIDRTTHRHRVHDLFASWIKSPALCLWWFTGAEVDCKGSLWAVDPFKDDIGDTLAYPSPSIQESRGCSLVL